MTTLRTAVAVTFASTALLTSMAHADTLRVGVTSAVNPAAAGTPPGASSRQLVIGSDVVFRERVITTDEGQAQILFLDQSSLMVGPNSTVVIDEFVYDPNTGKGNIAATLTQGSFRYIGGKLSKQGNATLKTPVASIGIRGSDVTVTFDRSKNQADVVTTHGTANIQTLGGVLGLRTGFGATIGALDRPPGPPTALTAAQILAVNGLFEGKPGKSAGAPVVPTDKKVSESGLDSTIEAKRLAAIETAAGGSADQGPPTRLPLVATPRPEDNGVLPTNPLPSNGAGPTPGPRNERSLNGFVAGFGSQLEVADSLGDVVTNAVPTDVEIRTVPDANGVGRVFARFGFHTFNGESSGNAQVEMGDAPGAAPATQSRFFDDTIFSAEQDAATSSGKAHINGVAANVTAFMATLPLNAVGALTGSDADTKLCECEFVNWGLWSASLDAPSSQQALLVLGGLWVAGKLPSVSDPSPQGAATFSGRAVGLVYNAANASNPAYFASGSFTNTYNFTQRSGNVTISNFDGRTFGGQVNAGSDWRSYGGSLSGSNLSGGVNGAFYGNRNAAGQLQVPKETAGNFHVGGSGYTASGVFAGSR